MTTAKLIVLLIALPFSLQAQETEPASGRISPKELNIPASPVFDLMGVTPSQINRTTDIKDFKVDWSFRSWKLNPNLALQSQPIWELLYNRRELERYQEAPAFLRRLSTLDLSVGTVQNEENDRRIGFALKMNLARQRDPLLARELYAGISEKYRTEKAEGEQLLASLKLKLDTTADLMQKPAIREELQAAEQQLLTIAARRAEEINARAKVFVNEHWNAASLDIALGRVYTYMTDSAGSLLKLRLNRNTAFGAWINGGFGIGRRILLSGLLRTSFYEEQLDFQLQDEQTGERIERTAVAGNTLWTAGVNLRYGGPLYTFFAELLYERRSLKTPAEALDETFKSPAGLAVVPASVNWSILHPLAFSFGGDWRVSRNLSINYGLRCLFDADWKLQTFTPVVSLSCMMR